MPRAASDMKDHSSSEPPEELMDAFKMAALSVTKLYKTSAAAQTRARIDGYQDCLDDLMAMLDKGVTDVRAVRRWAAERLEGRDTLVPTVESEDETDKADGAASSPEPQPRHSHSRANRRGSVGRSRATARGSGCQASTSARTAGSDTAMNTDTDASPVLAAATTHTPSVKTRTPAGREKVSPIAKSAVVAPAPALSSDGLEPDTDTDYLEPVEVPVPMQGAFTFRSPVAYPPESYLQLANLDLSDRRSPGTAANASMLETAPEQGASPASSASSASVPSPSTTTPSGSKSAYRVRHAGGARFGTRAVAASRHGRGSTSTTTVGQKRKLNVEEIFDLASLGYGKDLFGRGNGSKRSRQS